MTGKSKHTSLSKILTYLRGDKKGSKANKLERKMLEDPFLSDAVSGLSSLKEPEIKADLQWIRRKTHRPASISLVVRVAAVILLLLIAGMWILIPRLSVTDDLAMNDEIGHEPIPEDSNGYAETVKDEIQPMEELVEEDVPVKIEKKENQSVSKTVESIEKRSLPDNFQGEEVLLNDMELTQPMAGRIVSKRMPATIPELMTIHITTGSVLVVTTSEGQPLPGVAFRDERKKNMLATTDLKGRFIMPDKPNILVEVTYPGFVPVKLEMEKVKSDTFRMIQSPDFHFSWITLSAEIGLDQNSTGFVPAMPKEGLTDFDQFLIEKIPTWTEQGYILVQINTTGQIQYIETDQTDANQIHKIIMDYSGFIPANLLGQPVISIVRISRIRE